ncbi:hypothetical protein ACQCVE_15725 [Metabacillus sp. 113a]
MEKDYKLQIPGLLSGFDLWKSGNGCIWLPVSLNGFGNPENYGVRNLFSSKNGKLYLGTANPFHGCEVWEKDSGKDPKLPLLQTWKTLEQLHADLKTIHQLKNRFLKRKQKK